jgi:hypothetical protein
MKLKYRSKQMKQVDELERKHREKVDRHMRAEKSQELREASINMAIQLFVMQQNYAILGMLAGVLHK